MATPRGTRPLGGRQMAALREIEDAVIDEGGVLSFAWRLGDGQTATGPLATHTCGAPGLYEAVLTVTDDQGASNSTTVRVQVFGPGGGKGPGSLLTAALLGILAVSAVGYLVNLRWRRERPPPASGPSQHAKPK